MFFMNQVYIISFKISNIFSPRVRTGKRRRL